MTVELTEQSTHEDVQAAVDDIIDSRSDAEKLAADRDKPVGDMTAEDTATADTTGSTDTAPEGEDKAGADAPTTDSGEWLDDDLKAEVAAYGIDEKELADFTSREELERALRFFDRSALEAGRKAMAAGDKADETQSRDEQGRFATIDKETGQRTEPEMESKEGGYEITLDKDEYSEDLVGEFTRMRDHYERRIATLEARFAEGDVRAEEQRFDSLLDGLGHSDLFGKSGKESAKELQRRRDLFVAVKAQRIGLEQLGRPVDLDESVVNRVARMVFAAELGKKDLKNRTRKIAKQSNNRLGGSSTKAHDSAEPLRDEMRRRYKELDDAG